MSELHQMEVPRPGGGPNKRFALVMILVVLTAIVGLSLITTYVVEDHKVRNFIMIIGGIGTIAVSLVVAISKHLLSTRSKTPD